MPPRRTRRPKPEQKADSTSNDKKAPVAKGETVSELGKSVMYVFQAKNNDYWFGSNDRGVYRYDGKALVNFTTKDGLVSNRIRGIQEDKSGNIYFTTYEGISKFDGQAFTTLSAPASSDADRIGRSSRMTCGSWGLRMPAWSSLRRQIATPLGVPQDETRRRAL